MVTNEKWTRKVNGRIFCAHCDHDFGIFNYEEIILHFRQEHRGFYKHKWDSEALYAHLTSEQVKRFLPIEEGNQ